MSASLLLRPRNTPPDDFGWIRGLGACLGDAMSAFMAGPHKVEASVQSVSETRYSEWSRSEPAFSLLMPFELGKELGEVVVVVPGQLISQILDLQYGGSGDVPTRNSFSTSEIRLVDRMATHFLPAAHRAMQAIINEPIKALPIVTDLQAYQLPQYRDSIVLAKIALDRGALGTATIHCFIGYAHAKKMAMRYADANPTMLPPEPEWQAQMEAAALRVALPAKAVLTHTDVPVSQLLALRAGDILPIMLPADVPLLVAGRRFARGTVGETNGRAALKIENMEGLYSE